MNKAYNFNLAKLEQESKDIVIELYEVYGSIKHLDTPYDFGEYRYSLVSKFDSIIKGLKRKLKKYEHNGIRKKKKKASKTNKRRGGKR